MHFVAETAVDRKRRVVRFRRPLMWRAVGVVMGVSRTQVARTNRWWGRGQKFPLRCKKPQGYCDQRSTSRILAGWALQNQLKVPSRTTKPLLRRRRCYPCCPACCTVSPKPPRSSPSQGKRVLRRCQGEVKNGCAPISQAPFPAPVGQGRQQPGRRMEVRAAKAPAPRCDWPDRSIRPRPRWARAEASAMPPRNGMQRAPGASGIGWHIRACREIAGRSPGAGLHRGASGKEPGGAGGYALAAAGRSRRSLYPSATMGVGLKSRGGGRC